MVRTFRLVGYFILALCTLALFRASQPARSAPPPDQPTRLSSSIPISIRHEIISIPTYPYERYLEWDYNPDSHIFYRKLNWKAYEPAPKPLQAKLFEALVLENEFLKLTVLPQLGGRIYECVFKPSGHDEFYRNPVLKPTRWGPPEQKWWLAAGGLEWCLPVAEHGYETASEWHYETARSVDAVTVTVRNTLDSTRLRASIDISLQDGDGYFSVRPHLVNPTPASLPFKFWLTAMLAPGGTNSPSADLQFLLPIGSMTLHSRDLRWPDLPSPGEAFDWPIHAGRDLSLLGNWTHYLGFFERPTAVRDYMGVYDNTVQEGMIRVFPSAVVPGAKAFAPGYGAGAIPSYTWTDDGSSYVELHGGVTPTFDDVAVLPSGGQLVWTEYWYPVKDVSPIVYANRTAALGLKLSSGGALIGVTTTSVVANARLVLTSRSTDRTLFEEPISVVSPARPFLVGPIPVGNRQMDDLSVALLDSSRTVIARYP